MQKAKSVILSSMICIIFAQPVFPEIAKTSSTPAPNSLVMQAMQKELNRSFSKLKNAGTAPVYYLAYRLYDKQSLILSASYGALETTAETDRSRLLNIELRAGSPELDSTHRLRSRMPGYLASWQETSPMSIEDNEDAIRQSLWNKTDAVFKDAQKTYKEVLANKDVLVSEEDQSQDFSKEKPQIYSGKKEQFNIDVRLWQDRLRNASAIYKRHPRITDSLVTLEATKIHRYMVSSEGTKIEDERIRYELSTVASAIANDGMRIWLFDSVDALSDKELPDDNKLKDMIEKLAKSTEQLRDAHPAEPFAGPVILRSKAAGVFFHEVFGHRAEGHRQKDEEEGRTFTKMIGKRIMPDFISVSDDPTKQYRGGKVLNGFYHFDDEGVPAQKVVLVDHGILKNFLMSRSPIKGFNTSNGHGRSSPGEDPVARQGNLIIESSKQVPYAQLRKMLIAEAKKQGKQYGLVFDEIAGGFTLTQDWMPQTFKLMPLRVYKVYTDGRPDELLRGVSIIGTPLACVEKIMCAANDSDTFNGNCGAESGSVPVSASSPSLLIQTLEIERQHKQQDKPPLLPPPAHKG
jgi:predicted Zn-dependent protease